LITVICARKSTDLNGVGIEARLAKALKVNIAELVK